MGLLMGIDIGTSGTKVMLLDAEKGVLGVEKKAYDMAIPRPNYAEQDPELWWSAVLHCIGRLRQTFGALFSRIVGIGLSGQMHGLVLTDRRGRPLRPAILWMDQRAGEECRELNRLIPEKILQSCILNRIFPGFALTSLLWVKKWEPEIFAGTGYVMQPKDYIRYKLTGLFGSEVTDASATLLFDVVKRNWAWQVMDLCGFPYEIFPECHESGEIQGNVSRDCAAVTGLPVSARVIYGMGDQQAQSIGNGVFGEGTFICNIGTGGQFSAFSREPVYDRELRTHTFCHGTEKAYSVFGAILNAGMSLKWLRDNVLEEKDFMTLSRMAEEIPAGSGGLVFLPYLTGERTPHMDGAAKGMFYGLNLAHTRKHMVRAVMEGVTFALRDCMELLVDMGIRGDDVISSGGGASSPVWLQMQADILNREIRVCHVAEQACLGACMLAGVSTGQFAGLPEAGKRFATYGDRRYLPDRGTVEVYEGIYRTYRTLYQRTRGVEG
ncbi:xylulokinase [Acetatifactor muris]|uniref:xylulokinase n=1 Tax=Acetatifactor muris TaxID=879566 RepID=UPI0023F1F821|nr:xylulokinase [Acetatifactor muris]